jgi:hypothetical protein
MSLYGGALSALKEETARKKAEAKETPDKVKKNKKEKKDKKHKKDKKSDHKRKKPSSEEVSSSSSSSSTTTAATAATTKPSKKRANSSDDAAATPAQDPGDVAKVEAVEYLRLWEEDRSNWKFKKHRQVWLLQNMFHPSSVGRDSFKILLRYLEGMKGAARQTTLKQAQAILEEGVETQTGVEVEGVDQAVVDKQRKATEKLRRIRFGRADALARILA